jgi:hypothetical protein
MSGEQKRFHYITDPLVREVVAGRPVSVEALAQALKKTQWAAAADLANPEIPGPVAAKREDYADAASEALGRGNQWRCRAALRKFWTT